MHVAPAHQHETWTLQLTGFPPGADVSYALHVGLDTLERGGRSPFLETIYLQRNGVFEILDFGLHSSFPLWSDDISTSRTDSNGGLALGFLVFYCQTNDMGIGVPATCVMDASSTLTATLIDSSPWSSAPPCD